MPFLVLCDSMKEETENFSIGEPFLRIYRTITINRSIFVTSSIESELN